MANEETQPKNEYISGIAPDALKDTTTPAPVQEPAPAPAPVVQDTPPAPAPIANDESNVAQNMEAQEKAIVIPPSKPQVPESKPAAPEAKKETVSPAQTVAADIANEAYVAPKQPKTPVPAVKSGYYMQLASTPLKAEAPIIWSKLLKKYPDALSGLKANYQPASVPGKGDYIRVQAGPLTQSEANNRCKQLHRIDPKGGCLVLKR
jgi:hypothetical protein